MVNQARRQAQAAAAVPIIGMGIIIGDRHPPDGIPVHQALAVVNLASLVAVARQRDPRVQPHPRR